MMYLKISFIGLILICFCTAGFSQEEQEVRRYLYLSVPDKAQGDGGAGSGIVIFDIDNNHEFVRRIDIPVFRQYGGLRGFEASLANKSAYYTTNINNDKGLLGRFDLETEEILWQKEIDGIGDRASVTVDGSRLFVPTGWWHRGPDAGNVVIDALTGEFLRFHEYGSSPHNSLITPNGKYMLMDGAHWLVFMDVETEEIIHQIGYPELIWDEKVPIENDLGDGGVSPLSIDSKCEFAYFSYHDHVGFDIVDLKKGEVAHHVTLLNNGEPIPRRTHGVGLTLDETEVWISDQNANRLVVFDNTVSPPEYKTNIPLSRGGHGWITFSRDGKYAWCHTPDVIDMKTKEVVATLKDENGRDICGSKYFEAHFNSNNELVWTSSQFGLGYAPLDTAVSISSEGLSLRTAELGPVYSAYIYRFDGSLVREVLNQVADPSQLEYGLAEGLYYVRLHHRGTTRMEKMVIMR